MDFPPSYRCLNFLVIFSIKHYKLTFFTHAGISNAHTFYTGTHTLAHTHTHTHTHTAFIERFL